jgi:hypothetical protein
MKRTTAATAVLVGVLLAATGCSDHESTGTVIGQYRLTGGPAPGVNRALQGTIWAYAGSIELSELDQAMAVAHVRTDASGNFTMSLKPGSYSLVGAQGSSGSVNADSCGAPVLVSITASTQTTGNLVCSVP